MRSKAFSASLFTTDMSNRHRQLTARGTHDIFKCGLERDILQLIPVYFSGVLSLFVRNFDRLPASILAGRVGEQLCFDTSIKSAKVECSSVYRFCDCQDTMILKNDGFPVAQGLGNIFAFLRIKS